MPSQLSSVPPISCSSTTAGPCPASSKWMLMPLASIQGTAVLPSCAAHRGMGACKIQHETMPEIFAVLVCEGGRSRSPCAGVWHNRSVGRSVVLDDARLRGHDDCGVGTYDGFTAPHRRSLPSHSAVLPGGGLRGGEGPGHRE